MSVFSPLDARKSGFSNYILCSCGLVAGISFPVLTTCYVKLYFLFRKHKQVMESNKKFARITFTNTQSVAAISHEKKYNFAGEN